MVLSIVVLIFGLTPVLFAQQPLTAEEKLRLENAALLQQIVQLTQEVAQWRQLFAQSSARLGEFEVAVQQERLRVQLAAVVQQIEAARPGFTFDPKTGAFTPKAKE